jgi:hypothetical protein
MTRARRLVSTTLIWLIPAVVPSIELRAQARDERAVRAVVDAFFAAVAREQWDSAVAFIDLPRFEPSLKQRITWARSTLPAAPVTAEQLMASDSTMPRAVAEWEAMRSNKFRSERAFDDYSSQFAGVTSQQMLFSLSLRDAAARWLAARDPRVQIRDARRRAGCPLSDVVSPWPSPPSTPLAIAFQDDSTAYVIQSADPLPGDALFPHERVLPVRRTQAGWRIEARQDILSPVTVHFSSDCGRK